MNMVDKILHKISNLIFHEDKKYDLDNIIIINNDDCSYIIHNT